MVAEMNIPWDRRVEDESLNSLVQIQIDFSRQV